MIKKKGRVEVLCGEADTEELLDSLENLPDGEYKFLIYDEAKNRSLPQLKYLFGIVLKQISDALPEHPKIEQKNYSIHSKTATSASLNHPANASLP